MKIPKHLDEAVRTRAKHRCEYCQAAEMLTGQRFHVDHIIPRALDGETSLENYVWLALPATVPNRIEPMPLIPKAATLRRYFTLARIIGISILCGVMMVYELWELLLQGVRL